MLHDAHGDELFRSRHVTAGDQSPESRERLVGGAVFSEALNDLAVMGEELERGNVQLKAGYARIQELEQTVSRLERQAALAEKAREDALSARTDAEQRSIIISEQLAATRNKLRSASRKTSGFQKRQEALEAEAFEVQARLEAARQDRDALAGKLEAALRSLDSQKDSATVAIESQRAASEGARAAAEERAAWLAQEVAQFRADLEVASADREAAERARDEISSQLIAAENSLKDTASRYEAAERQLAEIEARLSAAIQDGRSAAERAARYEAAAEALNQQIEELQRELLQLRDVAAEHDVLLLQIEAHQTRARELTDAVQNERNHASELQRSLDSALDSNRTAEAELQRIDLERRSLHEELVLARQDASALQELEAERAAHLRELTEVIEAERKQARGLQDELRSALDANSAIETALHSASVERQALKEELALARQVAVALQGLDEERARAEERLEHFRGEEQRLQTELTVTMSRIRSLEDELAGARATQESAEARAAFLAEEVASLRADRDREESKSAEWESRNASLVLEIESLRGEVDNIVALTARLDVTSALNLQLEEQSQALRSDLATLQNELRKFEQFHRTAIEAAAAENTTLRTERDELQEQTERLSIKAEGLSGDLRELTERLGLAELSFLELKERLEAAQVASVAFEAERDDALSRLVHMEARAESAQDEAEELRGENAAWITECEILLKEVEEQAAVIVALADQREALMVARSRADEVHTLLEREMEDLRARYAAVSEELSKTRAGISDLEHSLVEAISSREEQCQQAEAERAARADVELALSASSDAAAVLEQRLSGLASARAELQRSVDTAYERLRITEAETAAAERHSIALAADLDRAVTAIADLRGEVAVERAARQELAAALQASKDGTKALKDRQAISAAAEAKAAEDLTLLSREVDAAQKLAEALEADLQRERAASAQMAQALRDSRDSALSLEQRIGAMASARAEMEAAVHSLYERLTTAEAHAAAAESAGDALTFELAESRDNAARLQAELVKQQREAAAEITQVSHQRDQSRQAVQDLSRSLASAHDSARAARLRAEEAERNAALLKSQIKDGEAYVAELLAQVAQKSEQITSGETYARRLESEITEQRQVGADLQAQLDAVRRAALSDKAVMHEYVESLREATARIPDLEEAQRILSAEMENAISSMQAENARLTLLIDTVQASHFWRAKRWLSRIRARLLRR